MDSLIEANVFFFITSIAVVIGGLLLCALLIYAILIFRDIRWISQKAKQEAELISMDINTAREKLKQEGRQFSSMLGFLKGILDFKKRKKNKGK